MKKTALALFPTVLILFFAFHYANSRLPVVKVNAEKMNVFYRGLNNPIYVEAENVDPQDLSVSVSGGDATIERGGEPGHFIVKVNSGWKVMVNVGQRVDSSMKNLGSYEFRVKRIPDPVLYVYNHKLDDTIPAIDLQNQLGIFTKMENFDFDMSFVPASYGLTIYHDTTWYNFSAKGALFTPEMKKQLMLLDHGDRVIFHDVNVMMKYPQGDSTLRRIGGSFFVIR